MIDIREYHLKATNLVPNSPRPLLHYKNVIPRDPATSKCDHIKVWDMFIDNGWDVQWIVRYGPTQLSHYHSQAHECMAVLSGTATIRFGAADTSDDLRESSWGSAWEQGGVELVAEPGDVFLIPSGVSHKTYNTKPESTLHLLTPGDGHGIEDEDPHKVLREIKLSGFTMMGAYNGGKWDFIQNGGDYEKIWSVPKPKSDPVFGTSGWGLLEFWRGSGAATQESSDKIPKARI
ncbi:hypothetical protein EDB81DRAFT_808515 [Dactylonectria macrodidyma]|uniref:Cupin type-1 domain-containing protein n=1 Tax=Dactylonectria macrodidyma TaxID=307937 RepID=A0A9P9E2X1_9HYPO|nr:hypothetical protein EDB81DRAFT_808515 [Dactylonectria macrodidyma]